MEDTRDQQRSQSVAPPSGPYAPTPQPELSSPPATPPAASPIEVGARLAHLLLRRLLHLFDQIWRLLMPRLGWVILTSLLLGMVGLLSMLLVLPRLVRSPSDDTRAALIQPADAVVDFLRGQQTYDADLMWETFSPELRSALEQREITRDALAQQVESERQAGHKYRKFAYVGGVALDSRQKRYFYAVNIESPAPERNGTFSFIFTVDNDGKIISVEM